jgi:hypothetical protein
MARSKRTKRLVAAALIVVLVVGTAVAYKWREARQADAALQRAGTSIKNEAQRFHRMHAEYPREIHLRRYAVVLVGTSTTETNSVDVRPDIRLDWYGNRPDPRISTGSQSRASGYAYCLSAGGRHWRLNATKAGTATQPNASGACPAVPPW